MKTGLLLGSFLILVSNVFAKEIEGEATCRNFEALDPCYCAQKRTLQDAKNKCRFHSRRGGAFQLYHQVDPVITEIKDLYVPNSCTVTKTYECKYGIPNS